MTNIANVLAVCLCRSAIAGAVRQRLTHRGLLLTAHSHDIRRIARMSAKRHRGPVDP